MKWLYGLPHSSSSIVLVFANTIFCFSSSCLNFAPICVFFLMRMGSFFSSQRRDCTTWLYNVVVLFTDSGTREETIMFTVAINKHVSYSDQTEELKLHLCSIRKSALLIFLQGDGFDRFLFTTGLDGRLWVLSFSPNIFLQFLHLQLSPQGSLCLKHGHLDFRFASLHEMCSIFVEGIPSPHLHDTVFNCTLTSGIFSTFWHPLHLQPFPQDRP